MQKKRGYNVCIVGATGLVGRKMMEILEQRDFPVDRLLCLASERSKGRIVKFREREITIEELEQGAFADIDIALFSAGAEVSRVYAPYAAKAGAVVVDNSSAYRLDKDVPLVIPEINKEVALRHKGIIANPNCSTIQMLVAIGPIYRYSRIRRIVVSTYQAVSGWGREAIEQLEQEIDNYSQEEDRYIHRVLPSSILGNVIPHIDEFIDTGYTREEMKMVNETHKILRDTTIKITPTCVRVPVISGHSEAVYIETEDVLGIDKIYEILANADGVVLCPDDKQYPMPLDVAGRDEVFVGRVRKDLSVDNAINLWIVSDNLRKGAALNAIQIAEFLINA